MPAAPVPPAPRPKRVTAPHTPVLSARLKESIDPQAEYDRLFKELRAIGPGAAISVAVHVVLAFILAIFVISRQIGEPNPAISGGFITGDELTGDGDGAAGNDGPGPIKLDAAPPSTEKAPDPTTPTVPTKAVGVVRKPSEVNVAGALAGRGTGGTGGGNGTGNGTGGGGAGGPGAGGSSTETERAVRIGLDWLKRVQNKDGHWPLSKIRKGTSYVDPGYPDAGLASLATDTGATSLALLSYLGAGHTHRAGLFKDEVQKGLDWLKSHQRANGNLYDQERLGDQQSFYSHGQGTIVLCEAFAMTHDEALREPTEKALKYLLESQHPETGGWKYRPQSGGDLSVFGWQVMAIQSARIAGLEVPEDALDRASRFLDLVQAENGARYRYDTERQPTPAMTAEGLLCRQYLGWPADHPAMENGIAYLVDDVHLPRWESNTRNVYFYYYATQVLHNVQGPSWEKWNTALKEELVRGQSREGPTRGSWSPKSSGAPDEHAEEGGRLYVTCMCILTLEVYYRHLPLYQEPPTAAKAP